MLSTRTLITLIDLPARHILLGTISIFPADCGQGESAGQGSRCFGFSLIVSLSYKNFKQSAFRRQVKA